MDHTYLRYECADSFGLTVSAASSKAPAVSHILHPIDNKSVVTVAGSHVSCWRSGNCMWKWGHTPNGKDRGLNEDELVCLDVAVRYVDGTQNVQLATGWVDGSVRIKTVDAEKKSRTISLFDEESMTDLNAEAPLVFNGHSSAVRVVVFDELATRLLSGGSNGTIVVWDVVTETGLFRLLGHKGSIVDLDFLSHNRIASCCSGDGLVKVWDLTTQSCTQTIANHKASSSLVRSFQEDRTKLVAGGSDGQVRVWSMVEENVDESFQYEGRLVMPSNVVVSHEKVIAIRFYGKRYIGVLQANSKAVDIFCIRKKQEAEKKKVRRLRRRQEKQKKAASKSTEPGTKRGLLDDEDDEPAKDTNGEVAGEDEINPEAIKASDEFEYLGTIRASHKIRSFCFVAKEGGELVRIMCALSTNALESHCLSRKQEEDSSLVVSSHKIHTMDFYGHPTGIRSVALSSDDRLACTVSKNVTKIWKVSSRSCIQSLSPELNTKSKGCYGLCAIFLPGNTHVAIGTREGHLILIDISAGDVVYVEEGAHDAAIWSIDIQPQSVADRSPITLVTGSADKSVKFWIIETRTDEDATHSGQPRFVHTRTLNMTDDVIAVRYSKSPDPAKRLVVVSTLDSTIKVLFDNTLKLFLSLYGHKLPALAIDCSDDSALLASSGADKTVKVWGLDFGDTHKTLHGHEDSVTDLRFVRRTHNFFTASKDGSVRYWDGDRFEQILLLNGHFAEVNSLTMSKSGAFVLSAGMDRQVRVWERTKDIVFLDEERELELEKIFDKESGRNEGTTSNILDKNRVIEDDDQDPANDEPQSEAAVRRNVLSVAAGDRLMEALELADADLKESIAFRNLHGTQKERPSNMLMLGMQPAPYIHWVLKTIKSVELEQCLVVLSLRHVERLLYYIVLLLKRGHGVELCSRTAVFIVKAHQNQIIATKSMSPLLQEVKRLLHVKLSEARDVAGYDVAALKLIARAARDKQQSFLNYNETQTKDIWGNMGIGSDVAAALESRGKRR